jgi:hypothetical protein
LPLPSDFFVVDGRLSAEPKLWTEPVVARAPTLTQAALARIGARDGFSPNLPVVFAVPGAVAAAALPSAQESTSPASPIRLIDLVTKLPVPFEPELTALDDTSDGTITMVVLIPERRLTDGRAYLVVVSGLTDAAGAVIRRAPAAEKGWTDPAPAVRAVQSALSGLVAPDLQAKVQLAFTFTTGTNLYAPFEDLKAKVDLLAAKIPSKFTHAPPSRTSMMPGPAGTHWYVNGTFNGWRFVGERGEIWPQPEKHKVLTLISLPERCPPGGCPVVIFCHGLQAFKETMAQVAGPLNARGIAVIGVDGLWHEKFTNSFHVVSELKKRYDIFSGLVYQHVAYQWQLVRLIEGDLKTFDVLPAGGDGVPDLDTTRIGFIGQSLGGISGVSVMAFEPDIDAAIFNVAGGGFYQMFTKSMLKSVIGVPLFDIAGLSPAQGYAATFMGSMANDFVDPLLTAGKLIDDPRPKMLQVGLDDGLVPNEASDTLARTLNLHLVEAPYPGKARGVPVQAGVLVGGYSYSDWGWGPYLRHVTLNGEKQAQQAAEFFAATLK